jgi:hypothetical protein
LFSDPDFALVFGVLMLGIQADIAYAVFAIVIWWLQDRRAIAR